MIALLHAFQANPDPAKWAALLELVLLIGAFIALAVVAWFPRRR